MERISKFFKKAWKKLRLADGLSLCLAGIILVGAIFVVPAGATSDQPDSNVGGNEVTLPAFSEIIAQSFSHSMATMLGIHYKTAKAYVTAVDAGGAANGMTLSNIGNVLGYLGDDNVDDAGTVWTKGTDAASKVMTIDTILGFYNQSSFGGGSDSAKDSNLLAYIMFGSMLNNMGIDEFRDAQANSDGIRMIIGYCAYVFYILAYSASGIMNAVIQLMQKFNIFNAFYVAAGTTIKNLGGLVGDGNKFLDTLYVIYGWIRRLRWIILGIAIVIVVASVTIWKGKGYNQAATIQNRWRKILYRFVIMIIGVPLIGMVYTECLNLLDYTVEDASRAVTDYVFQEFIDFEGWTIGNYDNAGYLNHAFFTKGYGTELELTYNTAMKSYSIKADGDDIDYARFAFAVNKAVYDDKIVDRTNQHFLAGIFGDGTDSELSNFSNLVEIGPATTDSAKAADEYRIARQLILNYARSATIVPDVLDAIYLQDYNNFTAKMDKMSGSAKHTAQEKLFGTDTAQQRIWEYVDKEAIKAAGLTEADDPNYWPYQNDTHNEAGSKVILAYQDLDGASSPFTAFLYGVAFSGYRPPYTGTTVDTSKINGIIVGVGSSADSDHGDTLFARTLCNGQSGTGIKATPGAMSGSIRGKDGANIILTYNLNPGGMSILSLYNYMHTKFEDGSIAVYSPDDTTNAGVGMMHYSVTTPYSGVPELIQLLYVISILFCIGIIGWVFGISLLMNTIIQTLKAIPIIFKVMTGSVQGFVEGLLTVLSICAEILVTIFLYSEAVNIIDLLIRLIQSIVKVILDIFNAGAASTGADVTISDPETLSIMSGLLSIFIIIWGTFQLIRWRQAITLTIKSMLTHVLNTVFGTSAEMPTGASSGMMKAAAGLAAGAMVAGALADNGTLEDVVNDLTDSDLGTDVKDKLSEGDYSGAMEDVKSFADGDYPRGRSSTADAEAALGDGSGGVGGTNPYQSVTDDQATERANNEEYGDKALAAMDQEIADAEACGDEDAAADARARKEDALTARAAKTAEYRAENYQKAKELGVADYGDYLREQDAAEREEGYEPVQGLGDAIPEKPESNGQPTTLSNDAQMAYTAARDGDEQTLRTAAQRYDSNGLTKEQADKVNQALVDNPDMTKEEVADMVDKMAQENFGDDHEAVVDKINEAAHRDALETYGDTDNSDGNARTIGVGRARGKKGQYRVNDNSSDEDASDTAIEGTDLPAANMPSAEAQQAYDAVRSGDINNIKAAGANFDGNGLTQEQHATIETMVGAGVDGTDIQSKIDEFAKENFGGNAELIIDKMNEAKGVSGTETYTAALENGLNVARSVTTGGAGEGFTESRHTLAAGGGSGDVIPNAGGSGVSGYGQQTGQMMDRNAVLAATGAGVAMGLASDGGGVAGTVVNHVRGGGGPRFSLPMLGTTVLPARSTPAVLPGTTTAARRRAAAMAAGPREAVMPAIPCLAIRPLREAPCTPSSLR